jgi:geranylgeranyl pyrophosphate synthase
LEFKLTNENLIFYNIVSAELKLVEKKLQEAVENAPETIREPFSHAIKGSGKKLRPTLSILTSQIANECPDSAILVGTGVEMLHLATLIHDDVVDEAGTRRGQVTVSSIWGPEIAVLVGDYLFASAATYVCETGNLSVIRRFVAKTIMELATGELTERMDLYNCFQTRDQYFLRVYNKTASLFAAAAECGALLSLASESQIDCIRDFGINIGMAFQIIDDILDFEADSLDIGKPVGNDLSQGILTLPSILALERCGQDNPIAKLCKSKNKDKYLYEALNCIKDLQVIPEAYEIARSHIKKAKKLLYLIDDSPVRSALMSLTDYITERDR